MTTTNNLLNGGDLMILLASQKNIDLLKLSAISSYQLFIDGEVVYHCNDLDTALAKYNYYVDCSNNYGYVTTY